MRWAAVRGWQWNPSSLIEPPARNVSHGASHWTLLPTSVLMATFSRLPVFLLVLLGFVALLWPSILSRLWFALDRRLHARREPIELEPPIVRLIGVLFLIAAWMVYASER